MLAALWAYDGWNNMPMAAGEVKDPGRNVPRALIGGMVAVMVIYCAANLSYFYALPWGDVLTSNSTLHRDALPVATRAAQTAFGESGGNLMSIAFVLSALGALNGATLAGARVPFAMARDGVFPARAGVLSSRTRVPVAAVLMQAGWACVLAVSGTYDQLTDYVIFASWIFYGLVTSSVFVLRFRAPDLPRPYKTLGYPVVPLIFVLVAFWLVVNTLINRPVESVAGLVLIALGLPVYWYFRLKRPESGIVSESHQDERRRGDVYLIRQDLRLSGRQPRESRWSRGESRVASVLLRSPRSQMIRRIVLSLALLSLPAAARGQVVTWNIDPGHTSTQFAVRHVMVASVRGVFAGPTGTVAFDPQDIPGTLKVEGTFSI